MKKISYRKLTILMSLMTGTVYSTHAANTVQFNANGTMTDADTGLMWKRCYEGQTWNGSVCIQAPSIYDFSQATALTGKVSFAGKTDWRIPSIRELLSLKSHIASANDIAPHDSSLSFTTNVYIWSSTPTASHSSTISWMLDNTDMTDWTNILKYAGNSFYVINGASLSGSHLFALMVRTEKPSSKLDIARKTSDYVDSGNGTVIHIPTGLMWQRCLYGQTWDGTVCTGTALGVQQDTVTSTYSMSKYSGNVAGKTDWRVPTEEELFSLVDFSVSKPAINSTIFPNDPSAGIWTNKGTPIDFYDGMTAYNALTPVLSAYGLRFVRTAQPSDYPATKPSTTTPNTATSNTGATKTDTECLLDWVEARVPDLLKPAHQPTQTAGAISYRAYPSTGVYLGVDGTSLLAVGGAVGSKIVTVGSLSAYTPMARTAVCQ